MTLISPQHHVLRRLEGRPDDIARYAGDLATAASVMTRTSNALKKISEGARQIATSVDAVREVAGETYPDLDKAATRYDRSGAVLKRYASALETAQITIHPLVDEIQTAHASAATARSEVAAASRLVRDYDVQLPWEDEVSDYQKWSAQDALDDARTAAASAESHLETLWGRFDRSFSTWSDAYDDAVSGMEDAFDLADNNDAWGEDLLPVLGWIAVGLAVVALFVTGPIALVVLAVGAVVAAAMLVINILKFTKGRGNWLDLGMSIIGLIPFARPLIQGVRGLAAMKATSQLFKAGTGLLRGSVRSTLPRLAYTPMSGGLFARTAALGKNAWAGASNAVNSIRATARTAELMARFRVKDLFLTRPAMNLWRGGHNPVTSFASFLRSNAGSVGDQALDWARSAPVLAEQASRGAELASRFEAVGTWVANIDFLGSWASPQYAGLREGAAQ